MHNPEIEWQFDADDLEAVGRWVRHVPASIWVVRSSAEHEQIDTYVDTEDWRFYRAGYGLRVRVSDGKAEAMLKSFGAAHDDRRHRIEISEPLILPPRSRLLSALKRAPGSVGERVRAVVGKAGLRTLFVVTTRRRSFQIGIGDASAELALDETRVRARRRGTQTVLSRVELEIDPRALDRLTPIVADMRAACGLRPAHLSKFGAGLRASGLKPGLRLKLGEPRGTAGLTWRVSQGDLAYAVLRGQFAAFVESEPAVRLGEDPEAVHDMRVAARRLRAALRLFRPALPAASRVIRRDLRWIGRQLGAVRDLDVATGRLEAWIKTADADAQAFRTVLALLNERRSVVRRTLLGALNSARYDRVLSQFRAVLRRGPPARPPARQAARRRLPGAVTKHYRRFRALGDAITPESSPADLHALRIAAKRLRYGLEFTEPIRTDQIDDFVERLIALQDVLGAHQDAQVALRGLRGMLLDVTPEGTREALSVVIRRYEVESAEQRALCAARYALLRGKAWRAVERAWKH